MRERDCRILCVLGGSWQKGSLSWKTDEPGLRTGFKVVEGLGLEKI